MTTELVMMVVALVVVVAIASADSLLEAAIATVINLVGSVV